MIKEIKKSFDEYFIRQPLYGKLILILTAGIFLPFWITVPVTFAAAFFALGDKGRIGAALHAPGSLLYGFLGLFLLAVPLAYGNYCGFACGILLNAFFILEFYIGSVMTDGLFDAVCKLCCGMGFFCAAAAVMEKLLGLQDRVMAFTYNPNFYAYFIEIIVLVCFYKLVTARKPIYMGIIAANLAALSLTQCRSAWIALYAGLFLFSRLLKKKKYTVLLIFAAVALAFAVSFNPAMLPRYDSINASLDNRFYIWNRAFGDFLRHPLFGRGLLAFYQISGSSITPHAHNLFLDSLESVGLVGTAVVCIFLSMAAKDLVNSFRFGDGRTKARAALCMSVIAATLIHGVVDTPIMGVQTGLLFFLFLALRPKIPCKTAAAPLLDMDSAARLKFKAPPNEILHNMK